MLSFFYIFALLNLCIKAEVCSIITISDSDDIIINKDSPFVGFDKSFFSGYNGCYDRDTLDGYIMYFRNPDDLISPGLGVTRNTAGLKWRLNDTHVLMLIVHSGELLEIIFYFHQKMMYPKTYKTLHHGVFL